MVVDEHDTRHGTRNLHMELRPRAGRARDMERAAGFGDEIGQNTEADVALRGPGRGHAGVEADPIVDDVQHRLVVRPRKPQVELLGAGVGHDVANGVLSGAVEQGLDVLREVLVVGAALGAPKMRVVETGGDSFEAEREQWDDGNNVVALEPGVVVAYERNVGTNTVLRNAASR